MLGVARPCSLLPARARCCPPVLAAAGSCSSPPVRARRRLFVLAAQAASGCLNVPKRSQATPGPSCPSSTRTPREHKQNIYYGRAKYGRVHREPIASVQPDDPGISRHGT
ncbi:hypothetical protein DENSPDRAFT_853174 [Dentipellis sp. KUC8613]|nr:hypothetical protein DENSPDRAFT_853174 [Dentipellis sp. KUC8613]